MKLDWRFCKTLGRQLARKIGRFLQVKERFSPLFVLMLLIYPTLLGFVFAARLATFTLLIPTPTVPGAAAPPPVDAADAGTGRLHGAQDLWETTDAGAILRTIFAFASIAFVHFVIFFHLCLRATRGEAGFVTSASIALWFTTTCFFLTYTSMARYGAHAWEWYVAVCFSVAIFFVTADSLRIPIQADCTPVNNPATATV